MKRTYLILLLLGACTAPQPSSSEGPAGLQGVEVAPAPVPQTYAEWLDSLPDQMEEASRPFAADFHGKVEMTVSGEEVRMEIQMAGSIEYADLRHFRETIDLHLDLGKMDPSLPEGPVSVSVVADADGEMLYIEPRFHDDWLRQVIVDTGMGFERMTFTLSLDLLEDLLAVYWEFLEDNDADLSEFLPEGMSMEEFFERGLNPAAWARLYLLTADITDFRVDSGEVRITAKLKSEWTEGFFQGADPQAAAMMDGIRYEMCFDRYSGLPTSMGMDIDQPDMFEMGFSLEFHDFRLEDDLFPPGHFQHGSTNGRTLFPLDTFVSISLGSMEGMMQEEDDDIPF